MKELLGFTNETRMSMGSTLERNAEQYPNSPAILYEDASYTHREFNEAINRYAHFLSSAGVKKGDDVMVLVDNRPELLMLIGAMSKLGAASALVNPNNRGDVLSYSINLVRGRCFIVGEELLDAFEEIKDKLNLTDDDTLCYLPDRGEQILKQRHVRHSVTWLIRCANVSGAGNLLIVILPAGRGAGNTPRCRAR